MEVQTMGLLSFDFFEFEDIFNRISRHKQVMDLLFALKVNEFPKKNPDY